MYAKKESGCVASSPRRDVARITYNHHDYYFYNSVRCALAGCTPREKHNRRRYFYLIEFIELIFK
ncbi:hypothetical protein EDWATA_00649 [Edwardsiella tarda ATCC 23685]|uniref:Uncharacterized protein n=1 Tax=Edwardsiella tarda ATCC 23685 TaxID=500638 RepID=D4F1Q6_EDWTA|nr:hypothetical protein EDWATA_00649 [Edwardsiella tarda ATCC 23685]